jgi:WD40 repeat protein
VAAAGLVLALLLFGDHWFGEAPPTTPPESAPNGGSGAVPAGATSNPLDRRKPEDIPLSLRLLAGGSSGAVPPELVAVLGDGRLQHAATVDGFVFHDQAALMISADWAGTLYWWDTATGQLVRHVPHAHKSCIRGLALSPDGTQLATGGVDGKKAGGGTVRWWDAKTSKHLRTLQVPFHVLSLAFSPDGKWLAVGSGNAGEVQKVVMLLDADTGKTLHTFTASTHQWIEQVAFSPDSRLLAVAGHDDIVRVFDPEIGQEVRHWIVPSAPIDQVAFHPDGKVLATGSVDGTVKFWDPSDGKLLHTFTGHKAGIGGVAFSRDGKWLATADRSGEVRLWDFATRTQRHVLKGHHQENQPAFSPDSRTLVAHGLSGRARLWDVESGKELLPHQGPAGMVCSAAFSPDGTRLASGGDDKVVRIWDLADWQDGAPLPPVRALSGHAQRIWSVQFSPDGKLLASASLDRTITLWDAATGKKVRQLKDHSKTYSRIAFSPDGKTLASGGADLTARLWDVASGAELHTFSGYTGQIRQLAFAPDGQTLATACGDGTAKLWDVKTCTLRGSLSGAGACWCVAFCPDGKMLATGHSDGLVRLWDTASGWQLATLGPHPGAVRHVHFHPAGQTLVSGGGPEIQIWDLTTLQEKQKLKGHTGLVITCAFRADGNLLTTLGESDGTLRLWDLSAPKLPSQEVRLFPDGVKYLHAVALTPDGRYVATANPDGTIYLLKLADKGAVSQVQEV